MNCFKYFLTYNLFFCKLWFGKSIIKPNVCWHLAVYLSVINSLSQAFIIAINIITFHFSEVTERKFFFLNSVPSITAQSFTEYLINTDYSKSDAVRASASGMKPDRHFISFVAWQKNELNCFAPVINYIFCNTA